MAVASTAGRIIYHQRHTPPGGIYQRQDGVFTSTYTDFGNYNYGAVSAAAGYTLNQALDAAAAENITGSGDKSGTPFGSNPRNDYFIISGYNDYMSGKIK